METKTKAPHDFNKRDTLGTRYSAKEILLKMDSKRE
jgi:hypothetical protein